LKWALDRLGLIDEWNITLSPLEMTRKKTGQKILFRGLDDPLKVTSITVETGVLCWAWLEEAYEIMKESDFDVLDESIRGECPAPLFKQWTITFNPWNERHWLKKRFFDNPDEETLAITTNYMCNEWLDEADLKVFERMKKNNPKRYRTAGLGEWGVAEGLIFENWIEENFDIEEIRTRPGIKAGFGLDFGYSVDPSALCCLFLDQANRTIYVYDELYKKQLTNPQLYAEIEQMGYRKERIAADAAEPKSISELRDLGMHNIRKARKGPDSIRHGIQQIQDYRIIVHPRCVNFITEISNYTWATDKNGNQTQQPIDEMNHLMDALRYGTADLLKKDLFSFE
jgi:phage terminase large subunit